MILRILSPISIHLRSNRDDTFVGDGTIIILKSAKCHSPDSCKGTNGYEILVNFVK